MQGHQAAATQSPNTMMPKGEHLPTTRGQGCRSRRHGVARQSNASSLPTRSSGAFAFSLARSAGAGAGAPSGLPLTCVCRQKKLGAAGMLRQTRHDKASTAGAARSVSAAARRKLSAAASSLTATEHLSTRCLDQADFHSNCGSKARMCVCCLPCVYVCLPARLCSGICGRHTACGLGGACVGCDGCDGCVACEKCASTRVSLVCERCVDASCTCLCVRLSVCQFLCKCLCVCVRVCALTLAASCPLLSALVAAFLPLGIHQCEQVQGGVDSRPRSSRVPWMPWTFGKWMLANGEAQRGKPGSAHAWCLRRPCELLAAHVRERPEQARKLSVASAIQTDAADSPGSRVCQMRHALVTAAQKEKEIATHSPLPKNYLGSFGVSPIRESIQLSAADSMVRRVHKRPADPRSPSQRSWDGCHFPCDAHE